LNSCQSVTIEPYNERSVQAVMNHSSLFNAMMHPFTRMVIYGAVWYQGEANRDYNTDKYACSLAKLIENWRQIWNERTNGSTNIQFPFGVVQVNISHRFSFNFRFLVINIFAKERLYRCVSKNSLASNI